MFLTPAQKQAASQLSRSVAVIAGAGSGKTSVLIEHYRHLVSQGHVPPHRILAFTFTEKASLEIKDRLVKGDILTRGRSAMANLGTLHAFLARLLRLYGDHLELDPEFSIMSEFEAAVEKSHAVSEFLQEKLDARDACVTDLVNQFGFARLADLFCELAEEPLAHTNVYSLSQAHKLHRMADEFAQESQSARIRRARLTFDDLERLAVRLLSEEAHLTKTLQARFEHILVDEFQDINPIQAQIINLLYRPGVNHLFIVGDPKQSIYRFRKARVKIFFQMMDRIQENQGLVVSLKETFRIPAKLTGVLNRIFNPLFSESDDHFHFEPMVSKVTGTGGSLHAVCLPRGKVKIDDLRGMEARWIAQRLSACMSRNEDLSQNALLFRAGQPMAAYYEELKNHGIPCQITRTVPLLHEPEVRGLCAFISYLAGQKGLINQTAILRSPFFKFSEPFILSYLSGRPTDFLGPFIPDLFLAEEEKSRWQQLVGFFSRWEELKHLVPASRLVESLVERLASEETLSGQQKLNLEHFVRLVAELETDRRFTLRELDCHLTASRRMGRGVGTLEPNVAPGQVQLLTIHAAKGLEFKRVFLPQLYAPVRSSSADVLFDDHGGAWLKEPRHGEITGLKTDFIEPPVFASLREKEAYDEREEAKRLLYVGMTRAQEELFLFLKEPAKEIIDLKQSRNWNEWLWTLLAEERLEAVQLTESAKASPSWPDLAHKIGEALKTQQDLPILAGSEKKKEMKPPPSGKPTYTVSALEAYLRCPGEYRLRHVLGLAAVPSQEAQKGQMFTPVNSPTGHQLKAQDWGLLVHEVMQFLDLENRSNEKTVIEQALVNQRIADPQGKAGEALTRLLDRLLAQPHVKSLFTRASSFHNEIGFWLDMKDFYVRGTIDRLTLKDGIWTVVDYKTDVIRQERDIAKKVKGYWGQLACYALAVHEIMKAPKVRTALVFTDALALEIQEWGEKELAQARKFLDDTHRVLRHQYAPAAMHDSFMRPELTTDRDFCHHCEYYDLNYCGVKGA